MSERKQVPEETISDEIRNGYRKPCGHIAECDCEKAISQLDPDNPAEHR